MVLCPGPPYLLTPTVIPCCHYRDLRHPSVSSPLAPLKQSCEMSDDLCIFPGSVYSPALPDVHVIPSPLQVSNTASSPKKVLTLILLRKWEQYEENYQHPPWCVVNHVNLCLSYLEPMWLCIYVCMYLSIDLPSICLPTHPSVHHPSIHPFSSSYNRWFVLTLIPNIPSIFTLALLSSLFFKDGSPASTPSLYYQSFPSPSICPMNIQTY